MNKTYVKRQLTLYDLGFPIDPIILKDYEEFNEYFEDKGYLIKYDLKDSTNSFCYIESNTDKLLLVYNINSKMFLIFDKPFGELYIDRFSVLEAFMAHKFNVDVNYIHFEDEIVVDLKV